MCLSCVYITFHSLISFNSLHFIHGALLFVCFFLFMILFVCLFVWKKFVYKIQYNFVDNVDMVGMNVANRNWIFQSIYISWIVNPFLSYFTSFIAITYADSIKCHKTEFAGLSDFGDIFFQ